MKRLLAIALHPITYFRFKKNQEMMVLFSTSCQLLGIDKPSIWDVDHIHDAMYKLLCILHDDKHALDGLSNVKSTLYWTLLVSRFKQLTITREETRNMFDLYQFTLNNSKGTDVMDVAAMHNLMVQMFGNFI